MCWGMYILCIIYIYSLPAQAHTLRSRNHTLLGLALQSIQMDEFRGPKGSLQTTDVGWLRKEGSICPEKVFVEIGWMNLVNSWISLWLELLLNFWIVRETMMEVKDGPVWKVAALWTWLFCGWWFAWHVLAWSAAYPTSSFQTWPEMLRWNITPCAVAPSCFTVILSLKILKVISMVCKLLPFWKKHQLIQWYVMSHQLGLMFERKYHPSTLHCQASRCCCDSWRPRIGRMPSFCSKVGLSQLILPSWELTWSCKTKKKRLEK